LSFLRNDTVTISLPISSRARTFIGFDRLAPFTPAVVNVTLGDLTDPFGLLHGRSVDLVCGPSWFCDAWLAKFAAPRRVSAHCRTTTDEICLSLAIANADPAPASTDDGDDLWDEENDPFVLFVSAYVLAGFAIGVLLLMLWFCWTGKRATRPEAFKHTAEHQATDIIRLDDVDDDAAV
jgi:hypothetical protein